MEKVWLKHYPAGVPAEVKTDVYPSLVSLLEPLMVVILGGMVGTIVVAMFLPLVAMIESLQGGASSGDV